MQEPRKEHVGDELRLETMKTKRLSTDNEYSMK